MGLGLGRDRIYPTRLISHVQYIWSWSSAATSWRAQGRSGPWRKFLRLTLVTRPSIYVFWKEQKMCSNNVLICGRSWALECGVILVLRLKPLFIRRLCSALPSYDLLTRSSSSSSSSPLSLPILFHQFRSGTTCVALRCLHHIRASVLVPLDKPNNSLPISSLLNLATKPVLFSRSP